MKRLTKGHNGSLRGTVMNIVVQPNLPELYLHILHLHRTAQSSYLGIIILLVLSGRYKAMVC